GAVRISQLAGVLDPHHRQTAQRVPATLRVDALDEGSGFVIACLRDQIGHLLGERSRPKDRQSSLVRQRKLLESPAFRRPMISTPARTVPTALSGSTAAVLRAFLQGENHSGGSSPPRTAAA